MCHDTQFKQSWPLYFAMGCTKSFGKGMATSSHLANKKFSQWDILWQRQKKEIGFSLIFRCSTFDMTSVKYWIYSLCIMWKGVPKYLMLLRLPILLAHFLLFAFCHRLLLKIKSHTYFSGNNNTLVRHHYCYYYLLVSMLCECLFVFSSSDYSHYCGC